MQMNRAILKVMDQHGYASKKLYKALEIASPCDLKDWGSGLGGFVVSGGESVKEFLAGFSEADIAKSARWSCLYAIYIKKGRFPEGEETMQKSEVGWWWAYYNQEMAKMDTKARVRRGY
jgi:hypothetical protein